MIIKGITLNNFRQYKGVQEVEFSTDKEKNVTVVLGINTSGKTTLIQAFNWCLYEKSNFKSKDIINIELANSLMHGSQEVFVEIILVHGEQEFTIRRTQKFTKIDGFLKADKAVLKVQYKEPSGAQQDVPLYECSNTVNKILPYGLSDYFFFDGERISDINTRNDVVSSVRGLMGLDVISTAMDRLDPSKSSSITAKLAKDLDLENDYRSSKLKSDLANYQTALQGYFSRRSVVRDEEIPYCERRKEELNTQLLDNKDAKVNQQHKITIERDIVVIDRNIVAAEDRLKKDFTSGAMKYFAQPLIARALKVIETARQDGVGIPHMNSKAIDYILKRGKCICGCDLSKNQGAIEKINEEKSLLPPQHIGTMVRTYKDTSLRLVKEAADYDERIREDFITIRENTILLDQKRIELKTVSAKICDVVDVAKIEHDYQQNEKTLIEKRDLLQRIAANIGREENNISNTEKAIQGLVVACAKNVKIAKCIAYSKAVYEWFKASYDKQETDVKAKLLASVNAIFEKMYHGARKVDIDNKYRINLITMVNDMATTTDESKGLEAVKNFSFIAGLVDLARRKVRASDDDTAECISEPYPLVMDAPFSNVDERHIDKISRVIPQVAEQVIFVVMEKDWTFAETALSDKVGASYRIEKTNNSETSSTIRRVF